MATFKELEEHALRNPKTEKQDTALYRAMELVVDELKTTIKLAHLERGDPYHTLDSKELAKNYREYDEAIRCMLLIKKHTEEILAEKPKPAGDQELFGFYCLLRW